MILNIILIIIGFLLLIKGADILVDGGSSIAKKLGISELVIGLTIVAFGTSAPELVVNIISSSSGNTELAIGNILGSNISNILLILGISAAIFPLTVTKGTVWKEVPLSLLAIVIVGLVANDVLIDGAGSSAITKIDGLILLCFFVIFFYYTIGISKIKGEENIDVKKMSPLLATAMIVGGLIGLTLGGKLIVDSAVEIALSLGVSEALIGLTIVAIGTSLPELATAVIAAYKKSPDMAVGTVVGSNIFNIFFVLGVSSTITPLPFSEAMNQDVMMVGIATLLLFMFMFLGQRRILQRSQGVLFILLYVGYIIYAIARG